MLLCLLFSDFNTTLLQPVQRICRYQLLLKEINKFTSKCSVENEELIKAIKTMDEVVGNINNEKEKQDVAAKTDLFVSRLEDHWVRLSLRSMYQIH